MSENILTLQHEFLPRAHVEEMISLYEAASDWERTDQSSPYSSRYQGISEYRMPASSEMYQASFDNSLKLQKNEKVCAAVRAIGHSTTHRCYRMRSGQGFRIHRDDYFGGRYAYVLYLNRNWAWDWGGLLHVLVEEGKKCHVVFPEFNLLARTDYSKHRVPHFVSPVAEWAKQPRYVLAVFGGG